MGKIHLLKAEFGEKIDIYNGKKIDKKTAGAVSISSLHKLKHYHGFTRFPELTPDVIQAIREFTLAELAFYGVSGAGILPLNLLYCFLFCNIHSRTTQTGACKTYSKALTISEVFTVSVYHVSAYNFRLMTISVIISLD